MSKRDEKIIRAGDSVKIINPEIFIRCGYETHIEGKKQEILSSELDKDKIKSFLNSFGIHTESTVKTKAYPYSTDLLCEYDECVGEHKLEVAYDKIARELAYLRIAQDGFGDDEKERKIYTERKEEFLGHENIVSQIKFVKTGVRVAPGGSMNPYTEEYDYEPGGLQNEKTHKILTLSTYPGVRIEAIHVEKIEKHFSDPNNVISKEQMAELIKSLEKQREEKLKDLIKKVGQE
jgi:WD40 repeat protein